MPASPDSPSDQDQQRIASLGLLIGSCAIADGDVFADVEFEGVSPQSVCEFAIAYDSNANHLVTAGLGGAEWAMFAVREYGGPRTDGKGWWLHHARGERSSLVPGRTYRLHASFRGAMVTLSIDGVRVAAVEVSAPHGRARQIGFICRGETDVIIRRFRADALKPKAFVVMQFGTAYDDVYTEVVKEVCEGYEVNVQRADEIMGPGLIIGDIVREIATSQLIIADISPTNANVYFEVGYALALKKPTILLAKKGTALPFDVAGFRVLFYEDSIGGKSKLEDGLKRHVAAILES